MAEDHQSKDLKEKKEKQVLFWSLVVFFMAVIIFLWLASFSPFTKTISEEETKNTIDWQNFSEKLRTKWSNFRDDWQEVKDKAEKEGKEIFVESTSTPLNNNSSSSPETSLNNDTGVNLEQLKEEIENLNNKLKNSNCPEWVNCMPTLSDNPHENKECVIPPGCEDITQIAY
ncbi:MAG: hypothetical protein K9M44_03870 [Candidatus Pacebacteria bacterium]|nr:hypothetical protein [Candidatus Paceibacterota bacterium]